MYHSLTITVGDNSYNTWADWHIVATSRPFVAPPTLKSRYVNIPGGNGSLDLTEALTKFPVYEMRQGSWEFVVVNDFFEPVTVPLSDWQTRYSGIMAAIHGRKATVVLEDDPTHFYTGRLEVESWQSGAKASAITIKYTLDPFRHGERVTRSATVSTSTSSMTIDRTGTVSYPCVPQFKASKDIEISMTNLTYDISTPTFIIPASTEYISVTGIILPPSSVSEFTFKLAPGQTGSTTLYISYVKESI